jgi:hypothetical protein
MNSTAPLLRSMGSSAIHTEVICQPFTGQYGWSWCHGVGWAVPGSFTKSWS